MTYQLVERKTAGVAVMVGVRENPVISSAFALAQGPDLCVVLTVQRGLTRRLVLEQLHLILRPQTERNGEETGGHNRKNEH